MNYVLALHTNILPAIFLYIFHMYSSDSFHVMQQQYHRKKSGLNLWNLLLYWCESESKFTKRERHNEKFSSCNSSKVLIYFLWVQCRTNFGDRARLVQGCEDWWLSDIVTWQCCNIKWNSRNLSFYVKLSLFIKIIHESIVWSDKLEKNS